MIDPSICIPIIRLALLVILLAIWAFSIQDDLCLVNGHFMRLVSLIEADLVSLLLVSDSFLFGVLCPSSMDDDVFFQVEVREQGQADAHELEVSHVLSCEFCS